MKILSLYTSLPSSVSLYKDGKIIAAVQEERFTRKKNDEKYPVDSINFCLEEANLKAIDLDAIAIASFLSGSLSDTITKKSTWSVEDYLKEQYKKWLPINYPNKISSKPKSSLEIFPEKIDFELYPQNSLMKIFNMPNNEKSFHSQRRNLTSEFLKFDINKIHFIEHHRCHAAYSYYSSPFRGENVLAFTIDGSGDNLNATIGIFDKDGNYQRKYQTSECNIGRIYRYITLLLGMKPNEHEYKVMGLAPYGKEKYAKKAIDLFKSTLYVDGINFKWNVKPEDSYFWFKERLEGIRFDNIAFALQYWVEELLTEWVRNAIVEFKIRKIVLSGGVSMNIKAMGKIAQLNEVDDIFVGGSASDESMSLSAGICLAKDLNKKNKINTFNNNMTSISNLYLGPKANQREESDALKMLANGNYEISSNNKPEVIAKLLKNGFVLARCVGKMEFGQRSLGNRSILADPINFEVKEKINSAIKNRDFWMPFAPIILDNYSSKYLLNPKKINSPYMTIGFETTEIGYKSMIAACHPADKSARPQILKKVDNPELYKILIEFEKITQRGALLNTSFNLHGSPIVNTPAQAIKVFINSGLDGLVFNNYLILKRI